MGARGRTIIIASHLFAIGLGAVATYAAMREPEGLVKTRAAVLRERDDCIRDLERTQSNSDELRAMWLRTDARLLQCLDAAVGTQKSP